MSTTALQVKDTVAIEAPHLKQLFQALTEQGYKVIGPTVRDGAVVIDSLTSVCELLIGWTDEQEAGTYRLKRREDKAYFGYSLGPQSWKRILQPPIQKLWHAERKDNGFSIVPEQNQSSSYAFIGVRPCELRAMEVQDKTFLEGDFIDSGYKSRRDALVVVVNCGRAGGTCFCTSVGSGPKAMSGFDLALTEIVNGEKHYFVVEVGSVRRADLLLKVAHSRATAAEKEAALQVVTETARHMGRSLKHHWPQELFFTARTIIRVGTTSPHDVFRARTAPWYAPHCFCTDDQRRDGLGGHERLSAGRNGTRVSRQSSLISTVEAYARA